MQSVDELKATLAPIFKELMAEQVSFSLQVSYLSSTVFENHRKSLIQHCERSEQRLHFEWTKVNQKCQKWSILASFCKPEACCQTVLPDSSVLIGQKLVENAKIQKFKCDILSDFQTMCPVAIK